MNICVSVLLLKLKWHQLKTNQSFVTDPPHLPDLHLVCTLSLMHHSPVQTFTPLMFGTCFNVLYCCTAFNPQTTLSLIEHFLHSGDQAAAIMTAITGTFQTPSQKHW